jgi:hypothetical protein
MHWILYAALLSGCSGGTPAPSEPTNDEVKEPPKEVKNLKLNLEELKKSAEEVALVPSPAEMQKSLSNAGLESNLSKMVPSDKDITMDVPNLDQVAVRTGVVLADLVLTVKTADKDVKLKRLGKLKTGFAKLQAGSDIERTIDELSNSINNDAVNDDDLLKQMDELSGVLVPELETEVGDWVVPLIQAGSWLEGAHLVSGAIEKEAKYDAASQLLRQPAVVNYFLKYVQREGSGKAPDAVVQQLEATLLKLKEIASKDALNEEDVKAIKASTGDVLKLL